MTKKSWAAALNRELRYALRTYHADSGISQEELASRMRITPGACSALENGEHGFSFFSMIALLSMLPGTKRFMLIAKLCTMMTQILGELA